MGNYTLGRLIGKGSFGKVYLATHKLTNGSKVRPLRARLPRKRFLPADSDHPSRSCSSPPIRPIRTLRERYITTASSSTRTSPGSTRSL